MKIGIGHTTFEVSGGAENVALTLINNLRKTEHFITLYTLVPPKIEESTNFKIKKIETKTFKFFNSLRQIPENRKLYKGTDVEDVLIFTGGGFSLYESKASIIIIYCNSTFSLELGLSKKNVGFLKIYERLYKRIYKKRFLFLRNSKVNLISNSEYTSKKIFDQFGKKSIIIYPPVDLKKFIKYYYLPKRKKVITISRFSLEKNLEFAIDVTKAIDIECEIIGTAKKDSHNSLYNQLLKKVNDKTTLFKNLSDREIENHLSTAKVYFHPSNETFGIAVIEAISAGCIPIVPNNSAHPETVPFEELRFNNKIEAIEKIISAVSGNFDYLKPSLKEHIKNFSVEMFQEKMLNELEKYKPKK